MIISVDELNRMGRSRDAAFIIKNNEKPTASIGQLTKPYAVMGHREREVGIQNPRQRHDAYTKVVPNGELL